MGLEGLENKCMKSWAEHSSNEASAQAWKAAHGCLLLGFEKMYEATGDESYKTAIEKQMEACVDADGVLSLNLQEETDLGCAVTGRLLYFMYRQTGQERYQKAIDAVMKRVEQQPRLAEGNFCADRQNPTRLTLESLYQAHPFYLEYENQFNGQKNYFDISGQFQFVRKQMYRSEEGLYTAVYEEGCDAADEFRAEAMGIYLMALVDCFDLTSEELYDCKRAVGDCYREVIKSMLAWQQTSGDAKSGLMLAYTVLKACRLELLLADKYQKAGEALLEAFADGEKADELTQGILMQAYGEYLMLHKDDI